MQIALHTEIVDYTSKYSIISRCCIILIMLYALVSSLKADIDQLKTNSTIYSIRLENATSVINDVKGYLKDLGNMMDRKFDMTNRKIDHALYFFIAGLYLKGGFNAYIMKPNQGKLKNPETAQIGK